MSDHAERKNREQAQAIYGIVDGRIVELVEEDLEPEEVEVDEVEVDAVVRGRRRQSPSLMMRALTWSCYLLPLAMNVYLLSLSKLVHNPAAVVPKVEMPARILPMVDMKIGDIRFALWKK